MIVLIDAHALIWFIGGDNRLTLAARSLIESQENEPVVSAASLWELAIKTTLGRLTLAVPFDDLVTEHVRTNGFRILPIEVQHLQRLIALPLHHRDPFDRLIVAQALSEQIPIVSGDKALDMYGVERLW